MGECAVGAGVRRRRPIKGARSKAPERCGAERLLAKPFRGGRHMAGHLIGQGVGVAVQKAYRMRQYGRRAEIRSVRAVT